MINFIHKIILAIVLFTSINILGQGINISFENSLSLYSKKNFNINPNYAKKFEVSKYRVTNFRFLIDYQRYFKRINVSAFLGYEENTVLFKVPYFMKTGEIARYFRFYQVQYGMSLSNSISSKKGFILEPCLSLYTTKPSLFSKTIEESKGYYYPTVNNSIYDNKEDWKFSSINKSFPLGITCKLQFLFPLKNKNYLNLSLTFDSYTNKMYQFSWFWDGEKFANGNIGRSAIALGVGFRFNYSKSQ